MVNGDRGLPRKGRFDAFEMAAEGGSIAGELDAAGFTRASDRLAEGAGAAPVVWRIAGSHDALRRPILSVTVKASLPLVCQRCLETVRVSIVQETELLLAHDEAELRLLDAEEREVVLASALLDSRTLIEDEILLSLPLAPRHAEGRCPTGAAWGAGRVATVRGEKRTSPFASLAELKKRRLHHT